MAYRNGTYVAFAADGGTNITTSDIRFYNILKAWNLLKSKEFRLINSHEKSSRLRSGSQEETIKRTLRERLNNSSKLLLLVSDRTKLDDDFVPYEIKYAIETCKIPVIVCYVNHKQRISTTLPQNLKNLWPAELKKQIDNNNVKTIHIPFRERILYRAINDYSYNKFPTYSVSTYTDAVYDSIYTDGKL